MFCQFIFNKKGEILKKLTGIEGVDITSDNINDLFTQIGITDEWKVGKQYDVKYCDHHFLCKVIKVENDFQFIGVDVTKYINAQENLETQTRISDLNMNRLLKTVDDLIVENNNLKEEVEAKNQLIKKTSVDLRSSLTDVVGLIEILGELTEEEKVDIYSTINMAAKSILNSLEDLKVE